MQSKQASSYLLKTQIYFFQTSSEKLGMEFIHSLAITLMQLNTPGHNNRNHVQVKGSC
jgi:hypothetical protein